LTSLKLHKNNETDNKINNEINKKISNKINGKIDNKINNKKYIKYIRSVALRGLPHSAAGAPLASDLG